MKKILVTTDGSRNSNKALLKAKNIATVLKRDIDIITVVRSTVISPYMTVDYNPAESHLTFLRFGEEILKEALEFFDDFEGEVNTIIKSGDAGELIVKQAETDDYNMIVMGSRGLGTFSRTMLGSVSSKVLNHSETSVLIVK